MVVAAAPSYSTEVPKRLYPLKWHDKQDQLKRDPHRFIVLPCGRRSGKTEIAKRKVVVSSIAANDTPWDDPRFFLAAPVRDQAKAIYWSDMKKMYPPIFMRSIRESDMSIVLENGAENYVVGMDKPQRIEGRPWDGGVLDEYANMKPEAWGENVRPALSDRGGWCWLIGVPEGRNHYYKLWQRAMSGEDKDWYGYTWPSSDILPPEEVESARRGLDELVFQQEYEASFVNFEGRAYYPFVRETHTAPLTYDPGQPLNFCFDFNVAPGVAVVVQELPLPLQYEKGTGGAALLDRPITGSAVISEVHIPRNSNTPAVCRKLIKDYPPESHHGDIYLYGDATGAAKGSAKVSGSDWDLIKQAMYEAYGKNRVYTRVRLSNPFERVRVNALNTRLRNGAKEIHLMVDPRKAPMVVEDLEGVTLLEGGSGELDKDENPDITHLSDALGYYIEREFPLANHSATAMPMRT